MGTRYRLPRRVKKARARLHSGNTLTATQHRLLARCLVLRGTGWKTIRHRNAHVAMGDTTCRVRERRVRLYGAW